MAHTRRFYYDVSISSAAAAHPTEAESSRLDYIFFRPASNEASAAGLGRLVPVNASLQRLEAENEPFASLSDHYGVEATFRCAA